MRPSALRNDEDEAADPQPQWAHVWHIWTLFLPRKSIDGSLIWGRVWRRHDGYQWIYKRIMDAEKLH
jgi:hypothetical protein